MVSQWRRDDAEPRWRTKVNSHAADLSATRLVVSLLSCSDAPGAPIGSFLKTASWFNL